MEGGRQLFARVRLPLWFVSQAILLHTSVRATSMPIIPPYVPTLKNEVRSKDGKYVACFI